MQQTADINDWHRAITIVDCKSHINHDIVENTNPVISAPLGFGVIKSTGWLDTALLVERYSLLLENKKILIKTRFDFNALQLTENGVRYGKIEAKHIVFTQGIGQLAIRCFHSYHFKRPKGS